jgi:FHA domain-containing protein
VEGPYIRIEETGIIIPLAEAVTTVGRGAGVDVRLADPSVSRLHAEIVRRGPYAYVTDLGLSRNGTRVNGRLVARRVLEDGDVLSFGSARCRVGGIPREDLTAEVELRRSATPELTRRELDVLTSLCRPALSDEAFVAPATAREIATDLVVTEAAVKQHLLRLYQKFRIPEGPNRRVRLANEVIALGLVRPLPPTERADPPQPRTPPDRGDPVPAPRTPPGQRERTRPASAPVDGTSSNSNGPGSSPNGPGASANGPGNSAPASRRSAERRAGGRFHQRAS